MERRRPFAQAVTLLASISRLHIVAIGALGTLTFGWLFTGRYRWILAAVCALDWFLVDLLNRVVDLEEDRINAITGTDFVARHKRRIVVLGFGVLGVSLVGLHVVAPALTALRVSYHLLGFAYNWPILPGKRRIKQLYFFKNAASAAGFVITVFLYPLADVGWALDAGRLAPGVSLSTILYTGAFFVLFELSYEVIYDLRDAEGDRAAGVRSYAVVHGPEGAVRIVDGLLGSSIVVLLAGYLLGAVPWRAVVMVVAPLLQLGFYKHALERGIEARDCIRLTWIGAGLLAAYHLWVVLKLPGIDA